jgi:hypothetical protein
MSGDRDGGAPVRHEVTAAGDAFVAGRDQVVNLPGGVDARGAQGVQVGGVQLQVNVYGGGGGWRGAGEPGGVPG